MLFPIAFPPLKPPTPLDPFVNGAAQDAPPPPLNPAFDGFPTALVVTEAPPLPPLAEIALPELGVNVVTPPSPPGVEVPTGDEGDPPAPICIVTTPETGVFGCALTCPPPPPPPEPLFAVPPAPPPPTTKTSADVTPAGTLQLQVVVLVKVKIV